MDEMESDGLDEAAQGMAGGDTQTTAPEPSAVAAPSPAQPAAPIQQQQQGPDWNQFGQRYGGFEGVQQRISHYDEMDQRYRTDPVYAQAWDKLHAQQQQQQQHPYDWMANADDKYRAELRQQGEQHPDFQRYQQEFGNFFQNPIGQLSQYATHPKVVESVYGALQPQIQDLASRMMEQQLGPIKQFIQQQGEQQFRQQYEPAFKALPPHIRQAFDQGIFGQGPQGIIAAIKFSKMTPQQQADAGMGSQQEPQGGAVNKNSAVNKAPQQGKPKAVQDDDAELERAAKSWADSKSRKK